MTVPEYSSISVILLNKICGLGRWLSSNVLAR